MRRLEDFWIRSRGGSLRFRKLRRLEELSDYEQFFAALLAENKDACIRLVSKKASPEFLDRFLKLIEHEALAGLVYQRLIELDLLESFSAALGERTEYALQRLRALSRTGASSHHQLDNKFAKILEITKEFRESTLWFKGAHLSRQLYSPPSLRHFGDFDVIVHPKVVENFIDALRKAGFESFVSPAYLTQLGTGPVETPSDIFLSPDKRWIPSSPLTLHRKNFALIDIKVGPFSRGIQTQDVDTFFADRDEGLCNGLSYHAPGWTYHLLIICANALHDSFEGWRILYDIHLIAQKFRNDSRFWTHLVQQAQKEGVSDSAWLTLSLVNDRFQSGLPTDVMQELEPKSFTAPFTVAAIDHSFTWNSNGILMLLAHALRSKERWTLLQLVGKTFLPTRDFLRSYYQPRKRKYRLPDIVLLWIHWAVLVCPAGLVRRTFGPLVWDVKPNF